MAWRAMNSLLVLRDQVNLIAPNRSKASDGLVGDENHETTSGHYPHYVAGVGLEIVTAWDCTNDPADGCDTWLLSETLRVNRDKRIRYVISNQKVFSSYATSSRAAWTWGPYSGVNPHTGHCHIQVLDEKISDTSTAWNLEGFDMPTADEIAAKVWTYNSGTSSAPVPTVKRLNDAATQVLLSQVQADLNDVRAELELQDAKLDQILALLAQGGGTFPVTSTFSSTAAGTIIWNPPE